MAVHALSWPRRHMRASLLVLCLASFGLPGSELAGQGSSVAALSTLDQPAAWAWPTAPNVVLSLPPRFQPPQAPSNVGRMVLTGVVWGGLGYILGAFLVGEAGGESGAELVRGGVLTESLLLGYGVHRGNHAQGELASVVGVSLAVGVGALAVLESSDAGLAIPLFALVQLGLAMSVERSTSR